MNDINKNERVIKIFAPKISLKSIMNMEIAVIIKIAATNAIRLLSFFMEVLLLCFSRVYHF